MEESTKEELLREMEGLRRRVAELEAIQAERERARLTRRRSYGSYRDLAESITDLFFATDNDLRYIFWNKSAEQLTGLKAAQVLGKSICDVWPDNEPNRRALVYYREALKTRKPQSFSSRYFFHSRDYVFEISIFPFERGLTVFVQDITEKATAAEDLRIRSQMLGNLSEGVNIVRMSDLIILYANPRMEEMFGYGPGELIGKHVDALNYRSAADLYREIGPALTGSGVWRGEMCSVRKDGTQFWCRASISAFDHSVYGKLSINVREDITEQKRFEAMLQESERNYRNSLDASPLGIRILSPEGERVYFNKAYLDLYGFDSAEELKATPVEKRFTRESYPAHLERVKLRKEGKPLPTRYECDIIRKDAALRHVAVWNKTVMWAGVRQDISFVHDITDRKLAEEELKKSSVLLSKTFSALLDAIFVVDTQRHVILTCNEAAERMFGYRKEEMTGRSSEFLHISRQRYEEMVQKLRAGLDEAGVFRTEWSMRRANGETFPTQHIFTQILDDSGRRVGVVGLVKDLTEQKTTHEALVESEKRSQMKSEILSNMSHELKSPLTSIKGIIDSLMEKDITFDERTRDLMLNAMSEEVERLIWLVEDLLDMSRIEAGVWLPRKISCQISGIIYDVVERQRLTHPGRTLNLELDPHLPDVAQDPTQIWQVLANLLSNSLAYAEEQSPVTIRARQVDRAVEVSVSDQGPGIPREELDRVFEKFYRGPNQNRAQGTGLGLAICRGIIEAHGGQIWAESQPGHGSTFYFRLPLA